ncbi:MAG: four helix bundle protein [Anaerolineales bacterium]|nr:four helix bundle protein [Anaerolineales bacterium]
MAEDGQPAYRDLIVWKKSLQFSSEVIDAAEALDTQRKHYRLIEQLEAAATSVPMNIAEGKGRRSSKEFMHFLYVARGSLYETMTLLDIFKMRGWISTERYDHLDQQANEIAKMLHGLIRSLSAP